MVEIRYYVGADREQPFAKWFADLDAVARAKVTSAIARLEQGNLSNVKSVGKGVLEYRIDFGPGYRVYFGRDGGTLVILLSGGKEASAARHRSGSFILARLQAEQTWALREIGDGENKELQGSSAASRQAR
jgi:putative addiction module killer protein